MADYWTTPKVNWLSNDLIGIADLNRIEQNIAGNRDANFRKVQGFGFKADNGITDEDGVIVLQPGSTYSELGYPIRMDLQHYKSLKPWEEGNGPAPGGGVFGGMAAAVTVTANTWYYTFVIMNPLDGSTDVMMDDNPTGTNISHGTYTHKRLVSCCKTLAAGADGSYELLDMYGIGDRIYMLSGPVGKKISHSSGSSASPYSNQTLTVPDGSFALPALEVRADLNISVEDVDFGLISNYGGIMTAPANMEFSTEYTGEFVYRRFVGDLSAPGNGASSLDVSIMVDAARQIQVATHNGLLAAGYIDIKVRGFHWERSQ